MFQLAFHLPYYALRSSKIRLEDHRKNTNGDSLRHSRDVSFLNRMTYDTSSFLDDTLHTFLYETQISCVVAGSDMSKWVAYCFVDTYFDTVEEGKETVTQYHEESLGPNGFRGDPSARGTVEADSPIQDPRVYFLEVFRIRISQVKREWQQVVEKVHQSVRHYEKVCSFPSFSHHRKSRVIPNEKRGVVKDPALSVRLLIHQRSFVCSFRLLTNG